jgi:hypothetical protein
MLKTFCMQVNLNFFMRSGAAVAHDVSCIASASPASHFDLKSEFESMA